MRTDTDGRGWSDWNERMYGEVNEDLEKHYSIIYAESGDVYDSFYGRRMAEIWLKTMDNSEQFKIITNFRGC